MMDIAIEAKDLGFTGIGVTGGELFLLPDLVERLVALSDLLPVVVLNKATLFIEVRLQRLEVHDDDHIVRPVVRRGRAADMDMGVEAGPLDLPAELTITVDGAFWSPFGPTVREGVLDTDLLITRASQPLATPAHALLRLVEGRPPGSDTQLNIR